MAAVPEQSRGELIGRRIIQAISLLWLGMLGAPVQEIAGQGGAAAVVGLAGVAAFLAVYVWAWLRRFDQPDERLGRLRQWTPFGVLLALSTALNLGFGPHLYPFFIFAGVGAGVTLPTPTASGCVVATTVLASLIGLAQHAPLPDVGLSALTVSSVGAGVLMVSYVLRTARELRLARAEVARLAVANERLRFARDLHDLLGHSLSLVALKADLVEQLIPQAPDRAVHEVRDVQRVSRAALKEVREAVAGYRQPSLATELAAAREVLAAAGIGSHVDIDGGGEGEVAGLPPVVDATLAWAVREAVTNVIRHSGARRCTIQLMTTGADAIRLEVVDDGRGAAPSGEHTPGHGLAGLAERLAAVGGGCQAGPRPDGGFRLAAWVPRVPAAGEAGA